MSNAERRIHVVVVELHHHGELIRNLIKVLGLGQFRMTLLTVPSVIEATGHDWESTSDWLTFHAKDAEETVANFIDRMTPVFQSADILYFNTVRLYWAELCRIPFSCPSIVRVHNAHADLAPASHFYRPVSNLIAILSHLIRKVWIGGEWRQRTEFFSHIHYFMFPNQAITDYVFQQGWVRKDRVLPPVMPFGFLGETRRPTSGVGQPNSVSIAITGKVTNAKKNYRLVYQALSQCLDHLQFPVRLVLLGKAAGKKADQIVADFQSLESEKFSLDYSTDYVSADEFETKVEGVHFLLAPIEVQTHFRKYREIYGKSKMSGIENDVLLYRKPSLITEKYAIKGDIVKVVETFEPTAECLANSLINWVNKKKYEAFQDYFDDMDHFKPEHVAQNFQRLCEKLIGNSSQN